jgi:hypothetical protein
LLKSYPKWIVTHKSHSEFFSRTQLVSSKCSLLLRLVEISRLLEQVQALLVRFRRHCNKSSCNNVCLCAVRSRVVESEALASPPRKSRCESLATIQHHVPSQQPATTEQYQCSYPPLGRLTLGRGYRCSCLAVPKLFVASRSDSTVRSGSTVRSDIPHRRSTAFRLVA